MAATPEYEVGGAGSGSRYLSGTGHPIRIPVVDLAEVSAGGGSIAWVDPAGALRVGPVSAGAEPGPVCYGRGGEQPTVTDANLVLGRLDASSLMGGGLPVDCRRAAKALDRQIARPLRLTVDTAAAAVVVDIVNNAMADALRTVSVERGHDPREFSLMAFGGAGPLHATALAEELEISEVIIPPAPGAFSALGLVGTDLKRDYARTWYRALDSVDAAEFAEHFTRMEVVASDMLERAGFEPEQREITRSVDVRYVRQAYELIPDSGGAGEYRGGLGARRAWTTLDHKARGAACIDRTRSAPFGLAGGKAGAPGRIYLAHPDGATRALLSKGAFDVPPGATVHLDAPGSGGYGLVSRRDAVRIREDLLDGYVTPAGVRRDYDLDPDSLDEG